jgi:hypothetical protein
MELNQLLTSYDDISLMWHNIRTTKTNQTRTLIEDSKDIGLEKNLEKAKYAAMFRHQNA